MYPRTELLKAKPIFLLEINWGTYTYRFATKPIHLLDDGVYLPFTGNLDNPQYAEQSELLGIDIEEKSVPLALYFAGVNISLEELKGNTIEGSKAELSYVLEDIHIDYDERTILAQGVISQPVYGHPDRPIEYVECSLESQNVINSTSLLNSINPRYTVNPDIDTDTSLNYNQLTEGKILGIAFGRFTFIDGYEIFTIPAYFYGRTASLQNKFALYPHLSISTTVKVRDGKGNEINENIRFKTKNLENRFFTYSSVADPHPNTLADPFTNEEVEYWAFIQEGLPNPIGEGVLEGAGDVCIWALTNTNIDIDYDAWYNVRTYLNEYKLAGYLQDPDITGLEWLQQEVLPYLPIEIVQGNNGLSPRLNLIASAGVVVPTEHIIAGAVFFRTGPVLPLTEPQDICNAVKIRFAWKGQTQAYFGIIDIGPEQAAEQVLSNEVIDEYCIISQSKYGLRRKTIELNYVYDYATAARIAQEYIRFNSMPRLGITYKAVGYFGWLQVGDIIELTDTDINIEKQKAQIVSKRWIETHWEFVIEMEINHISNKKQL
tara:strand:+ start:849 stop:2486 length:1638 start_codon:yes stop_codon:yes gene_type:complete